MGVRMFHPLSGHTVETNERRAVAMRRSGWQDVDPPAIDIDVPRTPPEFFDPRAEVPAEEADNTNPLQGGATNE